MVCIHLKLKKIALFVTLKLVTSRFTYVTAGAALEVIRAVNLK